MQTILGGGGIIGIELAKALPQYTSDIRIVSRQPEKVNPGDQLMAADLLNADQVREAVKGSEICYLTVGLPYNTKFWQQHWVPLMRNVVEACSDEGSKLVFFDNVYMYAPSEIPHMTEEAKLGPASKKGKVRLEVLQLMLEAMESGKMEGLIARSADFYGPGNTSSVIVETVFKNFQKGKAATWLGGQNFIHSFTYTPDAGKATALLGNTPDAYGQTWHLPTAPNPPTGKEWVEMIASEMGVKPKVQVAGKFMVRLLGLFIPVMREIPEMMYQNDRDYLFDSSKI